MVLFPTDDSQPRINANSNSKQSAHAMPESRSFKSTRWSVIAKAAGKNEADSTEALHELCSAYFVPLQTYAELICVPYRDLIDSDELLQEFLMTRFLSGRLTRSIEQSRKDGRPSSAAKFRNFLRGCLKRFLRNAIRDQVRQRDREATCSKPLDEVFSKEVADDATRRFDYAWAVTTYDRALKAFRRHLNDQGLAQMFDPFCEFTQKKIDLAEALRRVGRGNEKVDRTWGYSFAKSFKADLKQYIRCEIGDTLLHPTVSAIDDELRLFKSLMSEGAASQAERTSALDADEA